ncbi:MAG: CarD family transcriptional regulator [Pyrinomonadaceae bacterium]
MQLNIGQKVAYPNQGICLVEGTTTCTIGDCKMDGYTLRVLHDNSTIFVPAVNAESVGIRPIISSAKCRELIESLSEDFECVSCDWKTRSREFTDKLHSGDIFEAADVLKKLTFISYEKKLSFREQTMLEKAKFLIISEVSNADKKDHGLMESEIHALIEAACLKHRIIQPTIIATAATH